MRKYVAVYGSPFIVKHILKNFWFIITLLDSRSIAIEKLENQYNSLFLSHAVKQDERVK